MKAFQLHEFGGPDALRPTELPTRSPGRAQVLVRVRAVSLNYRDLLMSKGIYNPKLKLPIDPALRRRRRSRRDREPGATRFKPRRPGRRQFHARAGWTDRPTTRKHARRWEAAASACWPSRPCCPSTGSFRSPLISASRKPPPCRARA